MNEDEQKTPMSCAAVTPELRAQIVDTGFSSSSSQLKLSETSHPSTPNDSSWTGAGTSVPFLNVLPNHVVHTPPAKRFQRVRNPFEAALAGRLHLPVIASPSLFQRPSTPQLSSTQFEWTIDDVSSLKPVNVEVNETQFQESPDPDYEAKAQSAISSYFRKYPIVPSPMNCHLRNQRVILSELNSNTPIRKSGQRVRSCSAQTTLSLPEYLPPDLENALRPYFNQDNDSDNETSSLSSTNDESLSKYSLKDNTLRRKLFNMQNIAIHDPDQSNNSENFMHHNLIPIAEANQHLPSTSQSTHIVGRLSESDKSSHCSLSPIATANDFCTSRTSSSPTTGKLALMQTSSDNEEISPILPLSHSSRNRNFGCERKRRSSVREVDWFRNFSADVSENLCNEHSRQEQFTPDISSSPCTSQHIKSQISEHRSFNMKIIRKYENLTVSDIKGIDNENAENRPGNDLHQMEGHNGNTSGTIQPNNNSDDISMEMSASMSNDQASMQSASDSYINSDTPRSKRRSTSRKNLSQSFFLNLKDDNSSSSEYNGE